MADTTAISWADATFNPWIGCTRVSPACDHCYAERWGHRFGVEWGNHPRRRTSESNWHGPLRWERLAAATGERRSVFCASLADWLDNQAPTAWLAGLLDLIRRTPNLDWLLLTKRPGNFVDRLTAAAVFAREVPGLRDWIVVWLGGDPPPNVRLGTTAENQEEADRRLPVLLSLPAAGYFVSCEPLLGPIDLRMLHYDGITNINALTGDHGIAQPMRGRGARLGCVIAGGESGPQARPTRPDWLRALRDQCAAAGVAFHFKQWGEWLPDVAHPTYWLGERGALRPVGDGVWASDIGVRRVGVKTAGRMLDGVEWNGRSA